MAAAIKVVMPGRAGNGSEIKDQMPEVDLFNDLYDAVEYVIDYDNQYILNI